jgi:hypothetical protein
MMFAVFFLAEYANMILISTISSLVFLGRLALALQLRGDPRRGHAALLGSPPPASGGCSPRSPS